MAADQRQIASVLLGLISSLLACMQLNVALLNAEISYARGQLDICKLFPLSTGQNHQQKQLKRVGKHCCPQRLNLDEPVPGGTILSILIESEYVWTGKFDINTL